VPTLQLDPLRKLIAGGALAPVHLLVGDDVKLIEQVVDSIEATVDPADRPFAVERVYAGEPNGSPVDIAGAARILPMLGDRRIVIVMRAERLLKPKRKASSEVDEDEAQEEEGGAMDTTALEEYVGAPVPSSTLVFVAAEIDRSRRLTKRLMEKAQVTFFGGLEGGSYDAQRAALQQLRSDFKQAGRDVEDAALKMLVGRAGGDISKLRGDVERLMLFTEGRPTITAADVQEVSAISTAGGDAWALTNAIQDGNAAIALKEIGTRIERGDSPHMILGQLRWWVSNKLVGGAPDRVKPALDALLRTDLALKSSGGDDRVLMERLVVELTGRPVARGGGWR
jgi:DNA polymerase III delta subunit